jgi:hypothetical protein
MKDTVEGGSSLNEIQLVRILAVELARLVFVRLVAVRAGHLLIMLRDFLKKGREYPAAVVTRQGVLIHDGAWMAARCGWAAPVLVGFKVQVNGVAHGR